MAQRLVRELLDDDAQESRDDHREDECGHDGKPEVRHGEEAEICADHVDVAVREVDELDDTIDHGIAERDQGVDAAERHAVDELLGDLLRKLHDFSFLL